MTVFVAASLCSKKSPLIALASSHCSHHWSFSAHDASENEASLPGHLCRGWAAAGSLLCSCCVARGLPQSLQRRVCSLRQRMVVPALSREDGIRYPHGVNCGESAKPLYTSTSTTHTQGVNNEVAKVVKTTTECNYRHCERGQEKQRNGGKSRKCSLGLGARARAKACSVLSS